MSVTLVTAAAMAGGNLALSTSGTGTNSVAFGAQACSQLIICNDTGTTLEFRQGGTGQWCPVFDGTYFPILGITDASQIDVRRKDQSTTVVSVKARWEA